MQQSRPCTHVFVEKWLAAEFSMIHLEELQCSYQTPHVSALQMETPRSYQLCKAISGEPFEAEQNMASWLYHYISLYIIVLSIIIHQITLA